MHELSRRAEGGIDAVFFSPLVGYEATDKKALLQAAQEMFGVDSSMVVFFGVTHDDMRAALSADMKPVRITPAWMEYPRNDPIFIGRHSQAAYQPSRYDSLQDAVHALNSFQERKLISRRH